MNFPMFQNVAIHKINGQFFVQGNRAYISRNGAIEVYKPETFLTTDDRQRAESKYELLRRATAAI